ncbi:hypothetical protein QO014_003015 [Kaistia dalseonensis]|uniref:Uncharacterized protein n=1 Tax=Kaistia dalseonensis TaxID=410840 RepID=A0ABU0H8H8_9HYPH|nr:hypothetical protein [Kaistia dalseonensis]
MLLILFPSLKWPLFWLGEREAVDQDLSFRRNVWVGAVLISVLAWIGIIWSVIAFFS